MSLTFPHPQAAPVACGVAARDRGRGPSPQGRGVGRPDAGSAVLFLLLFMGCPCVLLPILYLFYFLPLFISCLLLLPASCTLLCHSPLACACTAETQAALPAAFVFLLPLGGTLLDHTIDHHHYYYKHRSDGTYSSMHRRERRCGAQPAVIWVASCNLPPQPVGLKAFVSKGCLLPTNPHSPPLTPTHSPPLPPRQASPHTPPHHQPC